MDKNKLELCNKQQVKKYISLLDDSLSYCRYMTKWELDFMGSMQRLHNKGFILSKSQFEKIKEIIWSCEVKRISTEEHDN